MNINDKSNPRNLSEGEIDEMVIGQAEDDSAWEDPITVKKNQKTAVSLPSELVARAIFLARENREPNWET
jgi:hypothetical protein